MPAYGECRSGSGDRGPYGLARPWVWSLSAAYRCHQSSPGLEESGSATKVDRCSRVRFIESCLSRRATRLRWFDQPEPRFDPAENLAPGDRLGILRVDHGWQYVPDFPAVGEDSEAPGLDSPVFVLGVDVLDRRVATDFVGDLSNRLQEEAMESECSEQVIGSADSQGFLSVSRSSKRTVWRRPVATEVSHVPVGRIRTDSVSTALCRRLPQSAPCLPAGLASACGTPPVTLESPVGSVRPGFLRVPTHSA